MGVLVAHLVMDLVVHLVAQWGNLVARLVARLCVVHSVAILAQTPLEFAVADFVSRHNLRALYYHHVVQRCAAFCVAQMSCQAIFCTP